MAAPGGGRRLGWVPFAVLLLALASMFLVRGGAAPFDRPGHHNTNTALHMAVARNLSPEHRFLMFRHRWAAADGTAAYDLYNRFGVGGYALVKLAILPFGDDLEAQVSAARMLALGFFVAAGALAFLSLRRLTDNGWLALAATLVPFSSSYCLHYSDMPNPEAFMSVFGLLLTFHGAVVFTQDGRFPQLPVKACVALLLGWQALAVLAPFVALGMAATARRAFAAARPDGPWRRFRNTAGAALKGRHALAGGIALAFACVVLGWNFTNEHRALDGGRAFTGLPSFNSMLRNAGVGEAKDRPGARPFGWGEFVGDQFRRIGVMSLPYGLRAATGHGYGGAAGRSPGGGASGPRQPAAGALAATVTMLGVGVFLVAVVALKWMRWRALTASLLVSGFCWALPVRHQAFLHDFIALFHIGVPLVFLVAALTVLRRWLGEGVHKGSAVVAAVVFVWSAAEMGRAGEPAAAAGLRTGMLADFEAIRRQTAGAKVFAAHRVMAGEFASSPYDMAHLVAFHLPGSVLALAHWGRAAAPAAADFVVVPWRLPGAASLTPGNRWAFLYERPAFAAAWRRAPAPFGAPLIRGRFTVHWATGSVLYLKEGCVAEDLAARLFIETFAAAGGRPARTQEFRFGHWGQAIAGRCVAAVRPGPGTVRIRTGERGPGGWSGEAVLPAMGR